MRWLPLVLAVAFSVALLGAARTMPTCGWSGTTLWAENLPDNWGLTFSFVPSGIGGHDSPSSYSATFDPPREAWFYTRHGSGMKNAPKFGAQYNDYKVICIAVPA